MSKRILVRLLYGKHYVVEPDGSTTKYVSGDKFYIGPEDLFGLVTQQKKVEIIEEETPVDAEELANAKEVPIGRLNVSNVVLSKLKAAGYKTANEVVEKGLDALLAVNGVGHKTATEVMADARAAIKV